MKAWAVVRNDQPLECIEIPDPSPTGTEVVVAVTRCGVCHSDLHLWHGVYNMGGGKVLRLSDRGLTLPRAPGHEIVGRVVAMGPDAQGVAIDDERIVFPWIGCGRCARCLGGEDNLCVNSRNLGVAQDGGFAERVKVPHPRFLVPFGDLDPSVAATYACSGITVYSAIRKVMPLAPEDPVLLVGAGGLGLTAIAMLRALGHENIVSVDISGEKRDAALAAGARVAVDASGDDAAARIVAAAGHPVMAAIDFVNASNTTRAALDAMEKGGRLVLIGLAGGALTLSLATMIFRAQSVIGSLTGTLQDLRDVLALAQSGRLAPTPIHEYPKDAANDTLMRLHHGTVTDTRMIHSIDAQRRALAPGTAVGTALQGTPEDVANLVLFLLSDLAGNITGASFTTDGGRSALPGPSTFTRD